MDQGILVSEQKDAGRELIGRIGHSRIVQVAFWLKAADATKWHLYLALQGIDNTKIREGYGELLKVVDEMRNPYLDAFRLKLITADHPLARDVMDLNRCYPGNPGFSYDTSYLGGMGIDGVYIYPVSNVEAAQFT